MYVYLLPLKQTLYNKKIITNTKELPETPENEVNEVENKKVDTNNTVSSSSYDTLSPNKVYFIIR